MTPRTLWEAALAVILKDVYGIEYADFVERLGESTLDAYFKEGIPATDVVKRTNFDGPEWDDLFDCGDLPARTV